MDKFLRENNLEIRHATTLAHVFEVGKPNYPLCGRIFPHTFKVTEDDDVALCKRCKDRIELIKEKAL